MNISLSRLIDNCKMTLVGILLRLHYVALKTGAKIVLHIYDDTIKSLNLSNLDSLNKVPFYWT